MADTLVTRLPKSRTGAPTPDPSYTPTITLSQNEVVTAVGGSAKINYHTTSGGAVSVSSDNTGIATAVKNDDNSITINGIANGSTNAKVVVAPATNFFGASAPIAITVKKGYRFGIRIKKNESNPSARVTYLYDAEGMTPAKMNFNNGTFDYGDWADVWFVKENRPLMLKSDGTVDYYLNPNDYTQKADGSNSDVSNTSYGGNAMAQFPLCYINRYEDDTYQYEIVSNVAWDGDYKAYAHTRMNGTIAPYFYWSMFGGSGNATRIRSLSGQSLARRLTAEQEIAGCSANGSLWYTHTWSQRELIRTLVCLLGKSTNSQAVFGNGNCQSGAESTMLATGTLAKAGQFYGFSDNTKQVKVFHVEKFWGDQWDRIAGLVYNEGKVYVKMTREGSGYGGVSGDNVTLTGYTNTGLSLSGTSGGYISAASCSQFGVIPTVVSGSAGTYFCDGGWFNGGGVRYPYVGASAYNASARGGAFTFNVTNVPSHTAWDYGCGL